MLCKFLAVRSLFTCEMNLWYWQEVDKLLSTTGSPIALLNLLIIHWSLSKNMTQEQNSTFQIESCAISRSKLTTCPRKGRLHRFKLNSTETSDGGTQKLKNYVWHDSLLVSIATKVCGQTGSKWNAMFESHVALILNPEILWAIIDRTSFYVQFEDFFRNLFL